MRNLAYDRVIDFLVDDVPEVRAAAVFALGCFVREFPLQYGVSLYINLAVIGNRSVNNEHATTVCVLLKISKL